MCLATDVKQANKLICCFVQFHLLFSVVRENITSWSLALRKVEVLLGEVWPTFSTLNSKYKHNPDVNTLGIKWNQTHFRLVLVRKLLYMTPSHKTPNINIIKSL